MLELAMVLVVVGPQREHRVPRRRRAVLRLSTSDGTTRIASMHHNTATDWPRSIEDIQDIEDNA
jgi:hypothetical protein